MHLRTKLQALYMTILLTGCSAEDIVSLETPNSDTISNINFDLNSVIELAPGSDNWAVTWGQDNHQYTTWGDGGGFNGNNDLGRVSMGVGKLEGDYPNFKAVNIWGGFNPATPATFSGKSYGLLSIGTRLWMWKTGNKSDNSAFIEQTLYYSNDNGESWHETEVSYTANSFANKKGFFAPTFLQYGRGYAGALDEFVYSYATEISDTEKWDAQKPGDIVLFRAPKAELQKIDSYEYFTGFNQQEKPQWSKDVDQRSPILSDERGYMRPAVNYNPGLKRFFLITQMESRFQENGGLLGLYEADTPWGPWKETLITSPWEIGLQTGEKSVFWNFSNKWTSTDGKSFVLIYTGKSRDNFGAIKGFFTTEIRLFENCFSF
jgi:hypothetical protein